MNCDFCDFMNEGRYDAAWFSVKCAGCGDRRGNHVGRHPHELALYQEGCDGFTSELPASFEEIVAGLQEIARALS